MITVEFLHKDHLGDREERPLRTDCFHNEMGCNVAFSEGWTFFFFWCLGGKCPQKKTHNEGLLRQFVKRSPLALETFVFPLSALKLSRVVCLSESPRSTTQNDVHPSVIKYLLSSDYFGCMNGLNRC